MTGCFGPALLAVTAIAEGATPQHQPPTSVAAIPVAKCTPDEVFGTIIYLSVGRAAAAAPQSIKQTEQMDKLMDQLPKSNRPVGELMTPAQSAEFAQLSAQMRIHGLSSLAESAVERDATVMAWAAEAIEKLRTAAPAATLRTKYDPGADGAALVGLMREALKNDKDTGLAPPANGVCSLDLALYNQELARLAEMRKLAASDELKQYLALRAKYKVPEGVYMDAEKLPSPDREKAIWLDKAVGNRMPREFAATGDWQNLRLFAKVSELEYTTLRDDIITGSGAKDYDYDTGIKAAYKASNSATQHMINVWNVINKQVPSETQKMMRAMAGQQAQSQSAK
jgi:hypothetical protein